MSVELIAAVLDQHRTEDVPRRNGNGGYDCRYECAPDCGWRSEPFDMRDQAAMEEARAAELRHEAEQLLEVISAASYAAGVEAGRHAASTAIVEHADKVAPLDEEPGRVGREARLRVRRHLMIAARVAEVPISAEKAARLMRQAAERGAVVVVHTRPPGEES